MLPQSLSELNPKCKPAMMIDGSWVSLGIMI